MSEMIERVARVLAIEEDQDPDMLNGAVGVVWRLYEPHARALIAAMREPTPKMVAAGAEEDMWVQNEGQDPQPGIWQAMIDEALRDDGGRT